MNKEDEIYEIVESFTLSITEMLLNEFKDKIINKLTEFFNNGRVTETEGR